MRARLRGLALLSLLLVSACATQRTSPPVVTPAVTTPLPTPGPLNAVEAGVKLVASRTADAVTAGRALAAFRISCPALATRKDVSGLTQPGDWAEVCAEAASVAPGGEPAFFRDRFDWVRIGEGKAFSTGYYEPEIIGSRLPSPAATVPVFSKPADLVRCTRPDSKTRRGRIDATGVCGPYFSRTEIEQGALAGKGLEFAYAADPIDLFFLQIQGSGRLIQPDGSVIRIGYADQNGADYVAVGRLLRERGLLPPGGATMDGIVSWMRAQPDRGVALMRENPSYIFFRELTGPGPLGAMGLPVTPRGTVAADPLFEPLGAPVFLDLDRDFADGLWVAQDTGGAIKGANRYDTFWGAGATAKSIAGGLSAQGSALVLLPKGVAQRVARQGAAAIR
ncbi:MAG: murein transglycosylase A [Sphingomonas bacterium]|nr:murein transglycosylase A [Sphingomonas bacterium]